MDDCPIFFLGYQRIHPWVFKGSNTAVCIFSTRLPLHAAPRAEAVDHEIPQRVDEVVGAVFDGFVAVADGEEPGKPTSAEAERKCCSIEAVSRRTVRFPSGGIRE